jgi:hypothetical protein
MAIIKQSKCFMTISSEWWKTAKHSTTRILVITNALLAWKGSSPHYFKTWPDEPNKIIAIDLCMFALTKLHIRLRFTKPRVFSVLHLAFNLAHKA